MNTIESTNRLMAKDRCDRCGARAYVRAILANGLLLFCAHHAREVGPALKAQALQVDDFTADLVSQDSAR
ncbi:MAG: hypothetical protein LBD90_08125 [Bifidobacteriaceae bacterium]|nr:hypothetical protein [Bifidobacteriaceae bacterium]